MPAPEHPRIYHIVHSDRLPSIVNAGGLYCDAAIANSQIGGTTIGMANIKERRRRRPVPCHPGTCVGDYVPFYFCPRSVMLYVISRANHPELHYSGGQTPIVHLEADLHSVVDWANENRRRWVFSLSNAAARYAQFRAHLDDLNEIDWNAVYANDWRDSAVREAKQAEFLVHQFFPWHLVTRIGVISPDIGLRVVSAIGNAAHKPRIEVQRAWYYQAGRLAPMIEYRVGDVLSEKAEALVNTVNCVGVMGRGVALQFKKAFPDNFKAYAKACQSGEVQPGRMFVFETKRLDNPRYIINFPTKRHWRGKSRIADIESGLTALAGEIRARGISSIALPPLGSGLGGLEWTEVRSRIEAALGALAPAVSIVVFEPDGPPDASVMARLTAVPALTPGRAALIMLMRRYLDGLMEPFVTLLEVHKLMYFLAEAGEPLRLYYAKAQYGPFAENIRHVLHAVEGHFVSGYLDGGDAPDKQLNIVPGAVDGAAEFLKYSPETQERLNRVVELVEGFETPFGLELLATVHWVITKEGAATVDDAIRLTYDWNPRKQMFYREQIVLACEVLARKGWLPEGWETDAKKQPHLL